MAYWLGGVYSERKGYDFGDQLDLLRKRIAKKHLVLVARIKFGR